LAESVRDLPDDSGTSIVVAEVSIEAFDPTEVAKRRTTLAPAVAQLQQRFPSILDYESRGSANLVINASLLGSKFGDDELASLAPISGQIVAADFSRTSITDRSSSTIASMKNLRSLRLTDTKITDATVKALAPLSKLESLNLFGTAVTADALTTLSHLPKLRHLYAQGTKISPDTPMPEELKDKIIF
jgi:Leucine-rich repeat (LRR) protein